MTNAVMPLTDLDSVGPKNFHRAMATAASAWLVAFCCCLAQAQTVYFSDNFNRPDQADLDANTNGMGGLLLSNGAFAVGTTWEEPVDVALATPSDAQVLTNTLKLGGNGHTLQVIPNRNFANDILAGTFSMQVRAVTEPEGTTAAQRYSGLGFGGTLAEFSSAADQLIPNVADLFVGLTQNGLIRINDELPALRPGSGTVTPTTTIDLDGGSAAFIPGTLRVDLTLTNTTAGSTVVYDVFFDDGLGGGFVDVLPGTRTFVWSGDREMFTAIASRSTTGVVVDDFQISANVTTAPPPSAQLSATPTIVLSTNTAQPVTLNWNGVNLPPGATYLITADKAVTFPGGGQSGSAASGSGSVNATVNGTLGDTTFILAISNSAPQLVASATATVTVVPAPNPNPPNVVVILFDDTGWADFSCYGGPIQTPNIDSLATNGLRFREFYQTARCSTTRCALMTGNYNQQVAQVPTQSLPDLRLDNNVTIPELLGVNGLYGASGYRTYMAGKWHIGTGAGEIPRARGFEHAFGQNVNASGANPGGVFDFWDESLFFVTSTGNVIPQRTYGPGIQFHYSDAIGDYSVDFINHNFVTNSDGRPFFLYMPFNAPHWPVNGPAALANKYTDVGDPTPGDVDIIRYEDGWDVIRPQLYSNQLATGVLKPGTALSPKNRTEAPSGTAAQAPIDAWNTLTAAQRSDLARRAAVYAAMIEQDDQNIGKVINRLKQLGQFDNTIIFIVCDNGANYEGGEFGNSDSSTFTPWTTADLPAMGGPQSSYDALGLAYNKYPRVNLGGAWANVSNTPFRFYKHHTHNGGIRTPMIVHWPAGMSNSVKGTWTDARGHLIDIMATIQDITGLTRPTTFNGHPVIPLQGISLEPLFTGDSLPIRDLGFEHEKNRAYYRGDWKLVTRNFALSDGSSPANELELYNMATDPSEITNRALTEPRILSHLIDAWNAWNANVGLPLTTAYLLPDIAPPQSGPAALPSDLFTDNFDRTGGTDADATAAGMAGSRVPPMGAVNAYYEGHEPGGSGDITVTNNGLRLCQSVGTSETGLRHNFIGSDITSAGGFSVQMRIDDILPFTPESNHYAGFAVGLTQAEAAGGNDIASPGSFRGNGTNPGVADCFIELDYFGNVKMWSNGVLLVSAPMHQNHGTLLASFATTSFNAGGTVTVTVFLDGQLVDLDPATDGYTRAFTWTQTDANYIGLSARATAPASAFVKVDNLAIRKLPLAPALATEYALHAGYDSPNNGTTADPDGDGDNNMIEWLKGGLPGTSDPQRKLLVVGASPAGEFRFNHIQLDHAVHSGVTYHFRYSTNLLNWTTFTPEQISATPDEPGYSMVLSRVPAGIVADQSKLFILMESAATVN